MSEWWQSDSLVDLHYRDRWEDIYGYDPLDPEYDDPDEYEEEDDDR